MPDQSKPVLGIDLGGTKILVGVVDSDNRVLGHAKRMTPARDGGDAIVAEMIDGAREALHDSGVTAADLLAVGIGSPGPLDADRGVILFSSNLNVRDYPLGPNIARALDKPTFVRNDVRAGGWGEYKLGAGKGYRGMLAAFVGTGIGGCVVLDGEIVRGATDNAGEVGHIIVKAGGAVCGCGRRGCMEAYGSKTAIARRLHKAEKKGTASPLAMGLASKSGRLRSRELATAFLAGDETVTHEIHRAARFVGLGLGSVVNVIGPEVVVIGGGVTEAIGQTFVDLIRISFRSQTLVDPDGRIPIVRAELGDDAGILGASLLARDAVAKAG